MLSIVQHSNEVMIRQRKELAELLGFETRNKYAIEAAGTEVGFAAEQGKGGLAFLSRMFLGHWRTFEIHFFDNARQLVMRAVHPFRFLFQRLEVVAADGRALGAIQQRFAIFSKRFDVEDPSGRVLMTVASPLWRPWTFAFERDGREVARVEKKWSGLLKETFMDADSFRVLFSAPELDVVERSLVLASGIFIDLQYFEQKAD
jgi:uncharacterized protein YxjI